MDYFVFMKSPGGERAPAVSPLFATTHWSVVMAARQGEDTKCEAALESLCQTYWYPLYSFVRRSGHSPQDAEDLTQAFFARLLEKNYLAAVSSTKGKFRSFLLMALKRFLADEWDRASAQKRGGPHRPVSLDMQTAETRFQLEPKDELTPERHFERRWAIAVLERARARLREEYMAAGKGDLFETLKGFHSYNETTIAYAEAAAGLAMPENTVKSHVHRLRKRYRQLICQEIAQTVSSEAEVEEETRHLLAVVGGS